MAMQIIDGFKVTAAVPIDDRTVVNGVQDRQNLVINNLAYEGLRVFDKSNGLSYVYYNNAWVAENSSGISGSGSANKIPVFTGPGTISDSIITYYNNNIGIGTSTPSEKLRVYGNVKAGLFMGDGSQLTNLNAGNISSGTLSYSRLPKSTNNYIFVAKGTNTNPAYENPDNITVGTSKLSLVSEKSQIIVDNTSTDYRIPFIDKSSSTSNIKYTDGLRYRNGIVTTRPIIINGAEFNSINDSHNISSGSGSHTLYIDNFNNYTIPNNSLVSLEVNYLIVKTVLTSLRFISIKQIFSFTKTNNIITNILTNNISTQNQSGSGITFDTNPRPFITFNLNASNNTIIGVKRTYNLAITSYTSAG
jgi:hypothetical protein